MGNRLQSNNIDSTLANQGIQAVSAQLLQRYDASADIGGRIVRDKLWFYGAYSSQSVRQRQ